MPLNTPLSPLQYQQSMAETKFSFNGAAANKVPIDNIGMVKVKDINDKNKENMLKLMLSPTAETKETTVVDESNSTLSATTSYLSSPHDGSVLQSHSETMDAILCVDTDIVDNTSPQSQDSDAFLESTYASISSQDTKSISSILSMEDKVNLCKKAKDMAVASASTTSSTTSADPFAISNQLKEMQRHRRMNMENLCNQLETQRELLQASSKSIITDINNKEAKQKKDTADKVEQISSLNKQVEETKAKNTEYKVLTKQLQTKNADLAVELGNMLTSGTSFVLFYDI